MRIAFELYSNQYKVLWVANKSIVLEVSEDQAKQSVNQISREARQAAMNIFRDSSVLYADFNDWLARGLCHCRILEGWPNGKIVGEQDLIAPLLYLLWKTNATKFPVCL